MTEDENNKLDDIKKVIGNPVSYLEETKVYVLTHLGPLEAVKAERYALWRLCEIYRKDFLKIIQILEAESNG